MFLPKQYHERQPLKTVAFGKTLVAFDFDEKLAQIDYVISRVKRLPLPAFCGYHVLSISDYDLENRRMRFQQNY